jgi:hypothetical protein
MKTWDWLRGSARDLTSALKSHAPKGNAGMAAGIRRIMKTAYWAGRADQKKIHTGK